MDRWQGQPLLPVLGDSKVLHTTTRPVFDILKPVLLWPPSRVPWRSLQQDVMPDHMTKPDQLSCLTVANRGWLSANVWQLCFTQMVMEIWRNIGKRRMVWERKWNGGSLLHDVTDVYCCWRPLPVVVSCSWCPGGLTSLQWWCTVLVARSLFLYSRLLLSCRYYTWFYC